MSRKLYLAPRAQTCQTEQELFQALIRLYARGVLREVFKALVWTVVTKGPPFPEA